MPVNPLFKGHELIYELNDTGAKTIVALDTLFPLVQEVKDKTKIEMILVTSMGAMLPQTPTIPLPGGLDAPAVKCEGAIDFLPALAAVKTSPPQVDVGLDDVAALNYTGGTTGMPKGCVHTQRDMVYTAATTCNIGIDLKPDDVGINFYPVFWIAGEDMGVIFPIFAGATYVLLARWDPVAFMAAVQHYRGDFPNPAFGHPENLAIAAIVLVAILLISRYAKGFFANIAVLLGIIVGAVVALALGKVNTGLIANAPWFGLVYPFQFGMPTFDFWSIVTMCIVMIVVMVESTGMFLALGEMTGKNVDSKELTKGLRADGVGTILGGIMNTFPYTSYSQNVGLVGVTGVRSRWVAVAGGVILLILGLIPKLASIFGAIPVSVLGGAGLVMFGMVAATGIRILASVDYTGNRNNLMIVALGIGFGMLTMVAPNFFEAFPKQFKPLLESGILLTTIVTVALNAFFNGAGSTETKKAEAH